MMRAIGFLSGIALTVAAFLLVLGAMFGLALLLRRLLGRTVQQLMRQAHCPL